MSCPIKYLLNLIGQGRIWKTRRSFQVSPNFDQHTPVEIEASVAPAEVEVGAVAKTDQY
jgi:hypothetical protein